MCASPTNTRSATSADISSRSTTFPSASSELDPAREIVVHCKMGGRSAKAVDFLKQAGFTNVHNLAGGINAWAERVDPKMPKY